MLGVVIAHGTANASLWWHVKCSASPWWSRAHGATILEWS